MTGASSIAAPKGQTSPALDKALRSTPFGERGGLGKAHQLFGGQLPQLLEELNEVLAA